MDKFKLNNIRHSYVYVRNHESYDRYNACKLGRTDNISDRNNQYSTREIIRGKFEVVFEFNGNSATYVERLLQYEFTRFNIRFNGGTEFYDREIINKIEPYLKANSIAYRLLSAKEVDNLQKN